jgi:hypothetical protein
MLEYKLFFFNARDRAEVIRLLFAAADQKYEDIRFEEEKWPEFKPKSPVYCFSSILLPLRTVRTV